MIARCAQIALLTLATMYAGDAPEQLFGRWKVIRVADASPVTAISGVAASRLVGQYLVLNPGSVEFARQNCKAEYHATKESASDFRADYKIDAKSLKLPDPATRFDGGCTDIFPFDSTTILFTWKGFFLEASKAPAGSKK